ncbi:phage-like protein [Salmonella bongori]|nr:phage-like protein [Salmonella bongori]
MAARFLSQPRVHGLNISLITCLQGQPLKRLSDLFLENLDTVVNEVSDEIGKLIWDYKRYNTPLSEMYLEVKKRIRLIINSYAYADGLCPLSKYQY